MTTTRDEWDYAYLLNQIRTGWQEADKGWTKWLSGMQAMKDRKLYLKEYGTFEDFCLIELKITASRAYQLMRANSIAEGLGLELTPKPQIGKSISHVFVENTGLMHGQISERVARELGKVEPETRPQVIKQALANGEVNLKSQNSAPAPVEPKPMPVDKMGFPIPPHVLPNWEKYRNLVQIAMTAVSRAKCEIARLAETHHGSFPDAIRELEMIHYGLSEQKPTVVCLECDGESVRTQAGCRLCNNMGVLGKNRWRGQQRLIEARIRKYNLPPYKPAGATVAIA